VREVADLYLSRNHTAWAEEAYAKMFASDAKLRNSMFDPARLAEYASLLEKYKALLGASDKPAELAKVDDAIKAAKAKQANIQLIQDQRQAEQAAQQNTAAQTAP
jgi:predicted nucleotidyltransferase